MKLSVQVVLHANDGTETVVHEVFHLDRGPLTPDSLGLRLGEAKDLLAAVQSALVTEQVNAGIAAQVGCPHCGRPRRHKDKPTIVVRSLFGTLRLPSPRWWHCPCVAQPTRTFRPLAVLLPERTTPVTLLRRLGNHSHKNRLYRAFRELGRVIRTVTLLRYLSEPALREQITAITNKAEGFHNYSEWLMIGGKLIGHNDPEHQERVIKFNELLANCSIYSTALDITDAANQLAAQGYPVDTEDLATITPYIQHTIRRMGDLVLNLAPPQEIPVTRLDLEPRVLFAART